MAGIRVTGISDVIKALNDLKPTREEAISILTKAANPVWKSMKQKAPVDKAVLQKAIVIKDISETGMIQIGIGVFDPDVVKYAIYQEFGTGKYATGPGGSRAKRIPWLWKVTSQKWADIFGIEVGQTVLWYGNHPHPFVRPAWDEELENVRKLIVKGISDTIVKRQTP
ncbi:MAG: HK97 gp10 family phage protein [Methanothrix sp.]|nr:HK97 gp10 family phage protein [Methanothrix sp.]